jgi:hypothetical protein
VSPLGFNVYPTNGKSNSETSSLSVTASSASPNVQSNSEQRAIKPVINGDFKVVRPKSRLQQLNRELEEGDEFTSRSPPPLAVDFEWSSLISPQPEPGQRSRYRTQTESPSPPPPPPLPQNAFEKFKDAAKMMKIVEMCTFLNSEEDKTTDSFDKSIFKVAASLRKLRSDWMLGTWIESITQASLAFSFWRQRTLSRRSAGLSQCCVASSYQPFLLILSSTIFCVEKMHFICCVLMF